MYFLPQHQQGGTAGGSSSPKMNTHTDVCAHPAAGSSLAQRSPLGLRAPTPCCVPACSHLCTTMSGIFLSAQLGGEVVCGAMSTACTWASARGELPSSPHTSPPTHPPAIGMEGRAGPRLPKSLGGASTGEPDRTHTQQGLDIGSPGSASQHCHSRWAAGLSTPPELSGASKGVGQCPTGHGWAPTAPPDIQVHAYVSRLCTYMGHTGLGR